MTDAALKAEDIRAAEVTVAVLNFNGRELLRETIESALAMEYPNKTVLVVDDGSTDGSVAFLRASFPGIPVVEMGRNTKMLNQVRNTALRTAESDYVLVTDNDISFQSDCLTQLLSAAEANPDGGVFIPRVMYRHDPRRIYIDRNRFHYVCASIDLNRDLLVDQVEISDGRVVPTFGCGIALIDKRKAARIGFFDESYPMGWGDDGEFHHRMNLAGMPCYNVPRAVVLHEAIKGQPRIYGQVRNRLSMIVQTYALRSLIVLLPAIVLYELSTLAFLVLKGNHGEYVRALRSLWGDRANLMEKRRALKRLRKVPDRKLFTSGRIYVSNTHLGSRFTRISIATMNLFLDVYWKLARVLI